MTCYLELMKIYCPECKKYVEVEIGPVFEGKEWGKILKAKHNGIKYPDCGFRLVGDMTYM